LDTYDFRHGQDTIPQGHYKAQLFFDTPNTNEMKREMRVTIMDQIATIGGALGLFTGTSHITMVEVVYWMARFVLQFLKKRLDVLKKGDQEDGIEEFNIKSVNQSRNGSIFVQRMA
jgi:hypothetical protein